MHSFSRIFIMAVFGVKYRSGLVDRAWRDRLYGVIGQTLKEIDGVMPLKIGGVADHVHILFSTSGRVAETEIIRKVKSDSSRWINSLHLTHGRFEWQQGSGRFSYSPSAVAQVIRYIDNQEEHHRRHTFREEYESILRQLGFDYTIYHLPEEPR